VRKEEEGALLLGAMLRQEELAFIKALGTMTPSPLFLRVLRRATVTSTKTKKAPIKKALTSSRAAVAALTAASKRKTEVLSSAGASHEPASRRPAPDQLLEGAPEATGERAARAAGNSALPRTGWLTLVLAGAASLQKPSGPHKSTAKGPASAEPTASLEAATRRMSLTDMSGPLCGMPDGTTPNAHVATTRVVPIGERPNKTPMFISGIGSDARSFLAWLRASCPGGLMAQLKSEKLMVVPSTADGFRAAVSKLRSLDRGKLWVSTP
jgi:hypothetical protein